MNNPKLLKVIILLLVLLNIGLMASIFMGKKGHGPDRRPGNKSAEKLKEHFAFDDSQMEMFVLSRDKHRESMQDLKPKLTKASLAYYKATGSQVQKDSLFAIADQLNDVIYKTNQSHFDEVRAICNPEQLEVMDEFIETLLVRRRPPPPKK